MIINLGDALFNASRLLFALKVNDLENKTFKLRFYFTEQNYLETTYPDLATREMIFEKVKDEMNGQNCLGTPHKNYKRGECWPALDPVPTETPCATAPN